MATEGKSDSEAAHAAVETLCPAYWSPIDFYVRRKGHRPHEAQDLTQEFFAQLIAKDHFRLADTAVLSRTGAGRVRHHSRAS